MTKNPTKVCANPLTAEGACKAALLILRRWYVKIQNERARRNVTRLQDDDTIIKRQNEINEEKLDDDDDDRRTRMQVDVEDTRNEVNENLENELKELQGSEIAVAAGC